MILAIVLVTGTIVGSFLPGPVKVQLHTQPSHPSFAAHVSTAHRAYHFATFGLIALVLALLGRDVRQEVNAALFASALGCAIEITQSMIGFASIFEWWDVRDDLYAATGAFLVVQIANFFSAVEAEKCERLIGVQCQSSSVRTDRAGA